MANKYYTHYSVRNSQEASLFSNAYVWSIFDILRTAGVNGLTAQEVHKQLEKKMRSEISPSKTYGILKRLYEQELVHRFYDRKVEKHRNVLKLESGDVFINKTFDDLVTNKEKQYISEKFFPLFIGYLKQTISDFESDSTAKKWLPQKKENCKGCGQNHEAQEFFNCLLDLVTAEFLESEVYTTFLKNHDYAEKEEDIQN